MIRKRNVRRPIENGEAVKKNDSMCTDSVHCWLVGDPYDGMPCDCGGTHYRKPHHIDIKKEIERERKKNFFKKAMEGRL